MKPEPVDHFIPQHLDHSRVVRRLRENPLLPRGDRRGSRTVEFDDDFHFSLATVG